MICLILGLVGSGKSAVCVREMLTDKTNRTYFSNIITHKSIKNNIIIKPEMIMKKTMIMKPDGKPAMKNGVPVYQYSVNKEFWQDAAKKYHGLNIIIDEAHSVLNSRNSASKTTRVVLDWISLLRRVLGSTESGYGKLYLVTQIERRLDVVAKEQTTEVRFHMCHYKKICRKCGYSIDENNEVPDPVYVCPYCSKELTKCHHIIEVWHFKSYIDFIGWKYLGKGKLYYKHYLITDIELVFPFYNTMQWDNLLVEM
jgi:hypothetical protein